MSEKGCRIGAQRGLHSKAFADCRAETEEGEKRIILRCVSITIWSEIQNIMHYNPQRTLLIDDNLRALQTAKDYGIRHLLCATHVSPKLPKIDPKGFDSFERYSEIMPD